MWNCPECDALLFQKNLSHSCVKTTVEEFLAGKPKRGVELFRYFLGEYKKIGPVILHPVKTRIALMVEVRFSAITKIGKDSIEGTLWLRERVPSPKFHKIEDLAGNYIHRFRICDEPDIDEEFRIYMKMSYAIGQRKHITKKAETRS